MLKTVEQSEAQNKSIYLTLTSQMFLLSLFDQFNVSLLKKVISLKKMILQ